MSPNISPTTIVMALVLSAMSTSALGLSTPTGHVFSFSGVKDLAFSEFLQIKDPASSGIKCAVHCVQLAGCLSFTFNKPAKTCRLHSVGMSGDMASASAPGTKLFLLETLQGGTQLGTPTGTASGTTTETAGGTTASGTTASGTTAGGTTAGGTTASGTTASGTTAGGTTAGGTTASGTTAGGTTAGGTTASGTTASGTTAGGTTAGGTTAGETTASGTTAIETTIATTIATTVATTIEPGALGQSCSRNSDCPKSNTECRADQCMCVSGHYYVAMECVQTWVEGRCVSDVDCTTANSECFKGQCLCSLGYHFSESTLLCVASANCSSPGRGYILYEEVELEVDTDYKLAILFGVFECRIWCNVNTTCLAIVVQPGNIFPPSFTRCWYRFSSLVEPTNGWDMSSAKDSYVRTCA